MNQFSKEHASKIHDYNFAPGSLVLVQNTQFEKSLTRKMHPRYNGLMIVISRNQGSAYIIAELSGAVLARPIGPFQIVPYHPRQTITLPPLDNILDISTDKLCCQEQSEDLDDEFPASNLDISDV